MRRLTLALGIILVLGIMVAPHISAAPQPQAFINYMELGGFNVSLTEDGKWLAHHQDTVTKADTMVTFSGTSEVTEVNVLFLTYDPNLDYQQAFWIPLCTILGLFPEELHEDVMNTIMVTIPQSQATAPDNAAQVRVGEFGFEGGFFSSPGGCLAFMLDIKAAGN